MTPEPVTAQRIREHINRSYSTSEQALDLRDDDDLLEALNSMQILRLVTDLESKFSTRFDNSDMTPENLGSIARVTAFVNSRR